MKIPFTLSLYVGRYFLWGFAVALLGLLLITHLIDLVELVRRSSGRDAITFGRIWEMAAFKIPSILEQGLPYAVLIGSMLALTRLTRSHELIIARAAGISVWQFLTPALALALSIGIIFITVLHPLSATMSLKFYQLEARYLHGKPSLLAISNSGLWLRQTEDVENAVAEHIIHADRISQKDMKLSDVVVFSFSKDSMFINRMDAQSATLEKKFWHLRNVNFSVPGEKPQFMAEYNLPTNFSVEQIQDSFAAPSTLSFWELPAFITILEKAGFSAIRHKIYLQSLLAMPFLLAGMVLVAAIFSLRLPRRGGVGLLAAAGMLAGLTIRLLTNIIGALGQAGSLPIVLSAWTPAIVTLLFGTAMLLHMEDG